LPGKYRPGESAADNDNRHTLFKCMRIMRRRGIVRGENEARCSAAEMLLEPSYQGRRFSWIVITHAEFILLSSHKF
jgi:hypothetical protein